MQTHMIILRKKKKLIANVGVACQNLKIHHFYLSLNTTRMTVAKTPCRLLWFVDHWNLAAKIILWLLCRNPWHVEFKNFYKLFSNSIIKGDSMKHNSFLLLLRREHYVTLKQHLGIYASRHVLYFIYLRFSNIYSVAYCYHSLWYTFI